MDLDREPDRRRLGTPSHRPLSLALLAVLVLGATAIASGPALAAAADSSVAAGLAANATGPEPHVHPDNPRPPDEIEGREDVVNSNQYPYSAIGKFDVGYSSGGSGVLVSEYHVLTAAHVVSDDSGEPYDDIGFRPGWRDTPSSAQSAPYGQAEPTDVAVHPAWDGAGPSGDLALVTLDRPVGSVAGHADLGGWTGTPSSFELQHAGYLGNVTGDRQLASDPWILDVGGDGTTAAFETCAPMGDGDSGSPIWRTVDGRPTLLGIHSWGLGDVVGCSSHKKGHVKLTPATVDLVESWMAEDEPPDAKADLQAVGPHDNPTWVEGVRPVENGSVDSLDESVTLQTVVYNEGPASLQSTSGSPGGEAATVRFYVQDGSTWKPVCSGLVSMGPYDTDRAECTADGLPDVDRTQDELVVGADVDSEDDVEEYADDSGMVQQLGFLELAPDADYVLTDTQAPENAAPGATFDVSTVATNRNAGEHGGPDSELPASTVVEVDLTHGSCTPAATEVQAQPGTSETVTASCTVASDATVDETTLTISTGNDTVTRTIDLTDVNYNADASFEVADADVSGLPVGLEVPAIEPGEGITVSAEIENVESEPGARYVHLTVTDDFDFEAVSSEYSWEPTCTNLPDDGNFQSTRLLELDPGQRTEVSFHCELPYDVQFPPAPDDPDEIPLRIQIGVQNQPDVVDAPPVRRFVEQLSDERRLAVTPPGDPAFEVESASGPGTVTVGEPARAVASIYSDGSPDEQVVELVANGTVLDRSHVELDRYEGQHVSLGFTATPELAGVEEATVRTETHSRSVPLEIETRGIDVAVESAPRNVTHATERVAVETSVGSEAGTDGPIDVELLAGGDRVANRTLDLSPGQTTALELAGRVDVAETESLSLTVRAGSASATRTIQVLPPLNASFGSNQPAPYGDDGRYRDFDGDGDADQTDVVAFFEYQHRETVKEHAQYFDFSESGGVSHGDVIALFEYVTLN